MMMMMMERGECGEMIVEWIVDDGVIDGWRDTERMMSDKRKEG